MAKQGLAQVEHLRAHLLQDDGQEEGDEADAQEVPVSQVCSSTTVGHEVPPF